MKLLLTSGGVTNGSIRDELVDLLGKPISECAALFIPTAQWGQPACSPESVWRSTAGRWPGGTSLTELGWNSVGVLELTALPTVGEDRWVPWLQDADVLLVDGGEAMYLCHWMRESGLADLVPSLSEKVWVGVSAGSMVMTPRVGREFLDWKPDGGDETLGLVDFSIFPHLDYPGWSSNTTAAAREWATKVPGPAYAIDDQTAISVVDGVVRVISEGHWELLNDTASRRPSNFEFTERADRVEIRHNGRLAATLRKSAARKFLSDVERGDPQQLMARITGNYKRGSERSTEHRQ